MQNTKEEHRAAIKELAEEALADHVISAEQEEGPVRMWLCHRPGTGMYHYRVISAPRMLTVYGDVGDNIIVNHDKDMVEWLRKAIRSPEYVISKFVYRPTEFFDDSAKELLNRLIEEARETDEELGYNIDEDDNKIIGMYESEATKFKVNVLNDWDSEYDDGHDFAKAFYNNGGDVEYLNSVSDYNSSVYWTLECLKKFVELYDNLHKDA